MYLSNIPSFMHSVYCMNIKKNKSKNYSLKVTYSIIVLIR